MRRFSSQPAEPERAARAVALGQDCLDLVAAQHGAHPGEQLARAERLGNVIVRAKLEPHHAIRLLVAPREEHDRHVRPFAKRARELHPILARQLEVEQHQVDRLALEHLEHLAPGRADRYAQIVLAQVFDHQLAHADVVIDHENVRTRGAVHDFCRAGCAIATVGTGFAGGRRIES